jgi:hypothetical protein
MLERQIQSDIKNTLEKMGYMVWKNLTEGMRTGGNGRAKNPNKGLPDLSAIKNGNTHYIEVKTKNGELSNHQRQWHQKAYNHGVVVHVVTSVDDILNIFK